MKKQFCAMLILELFSLSIFAGGKKDITDRTVGDETSWQEQFDINDKKSGKYNILVTAKDRAGNTTISGPFNIYLDPESDLPVTSITNPSPNMRVPGNLNIVGTCVDDDSVQAVYLILDGDEENPVLAEGTEFWSYYLDTTTLAEGLHTIEVYGIDDGNPKAYTDELGNVDSEKVIPKVGKRASVTWHLDRHLPDTQVNNLGMGVLVSGRITLEGTVFDGNGIKQLSYSLDGGHQFKTLKLREKRRSEPASDGSMTEYSFSLPIDTRKLDDGPALCWFSAVDNMGSRGTFSFLYFVDNTKPDVKIVTPTAQEKVNGKFTVAGYAKDKIGLKSLSWKWGQESGNFNLIAGNPYWAVEVESLLDKKNQDFVITAVDTMGNSVSVKQNISFDHEADKPTVRILYPADGELIEGDEDSLFVWGQAFDDDGVSNVFFSVDGSSWKNLEVTGTFSASFKDLCAEQLDFGKHTISVYAVDMHGLRGNVKTLTFLSKGRPPRFEEKTNALLPINPESGEKYELAISSDSGLSTLDYTLEWENSGNRVFSSNKKEITEGTKNFLFSLDLSDSELPWGLFSLTVNATDIYGRKSSFTRILNLLDLTKPFAPKRGIFFDDSLVKENGDIYLAGAEKTSVSAYVLGGKVISAEIKGNAPSVNIIIEENRIEISSEKETEDFTLNAKLESGEVFTSRTLRFTLLKAAPDISLTENPAEDNATLDFFAEPLDVQFLSIDGKPYKNGASFVLEKKSTQENAKILTAKIDSKTQISSVDFEILSGSQRKTGSVQVKESADLDGFFAEIPLFALPAGLLRVSVTAKDVNGSVATAYGNFFVLRSHQIVSDAEIFWESENKILNEAETVSAILGFVTDDFLESLSATVATVEKNAEDFSVSVDKNRIALMATKDGFYKDVQVVLRSESGGIWKAPKISFVKDSQKPEITLKTPQVNDFVSETFDFAGKASDENGIQSLEYAVFGKKIRQLDDGTEKEVFEQNPWQPILCDSEGNFSAKVFVGDFSEGFIGLLFRASDSAGQKTVAPFAFQKDTLPPKVSVLLPEAGDVINGETLFVFNAEDSGVITDVFFETKDGSIKKNLVLAEQKNEAGQIIPSKVSVLLGAEDSPLENEMRIQFKDKNKNQTLLSSYDFLVDTQSDLPTAEIHLPLEGAVLTTDFTISGILYDDDGKCRVLYKIDDGEFAPLDDFRDSFDIFMPLHNFTDNAHSVTVVAEDVHGVRGKEVVRNFKISLEEPKGGVTSPSIDETVKENVQLVGWASDKNGISSVQISLDNGATYNDAVLLPSESDELFTWTYEFDTHVIQDGTHVLFIKLSDGYKITGLYSSLVNIDNTPPKLSLEFPLDGSKTTRNVFFSGQTTDNIGLEELYITVRSLDGKTVPELLSRMDLVPDEIISQGINISELQDGFYNLELAGTDAAGNITRVSRNIQLDKNVSLTRVDLLYPLNGEHLNGDFTVHGQVATESEKIDHLDFYIDGDFVPEAEGGTLSETMYFSFKLSHILRNKMETLKKDSSDSEEENAEIEDKRDFFELLPGEHRYYVVAVTSSGRNIQSQEKTFVYSPNGPWVTLETFEYGNFAVDRPIISGNAGYSLSLEEKTALHSRETNSEEKKKLSEKKVKQVFLSFDNGKTYTPVSKEGRGAWKYRVENQDIPAGIHFMLVKAEMENGESCTTRTIVQVDRTNPQITLISPDEGGRYNQQLEFDGLTFDDVDLKDVTLTLRKGDKAGYEVPGFIQGLYFDASVWGASLWSVGVGLTAFSNAVKIQVDYGQFTQNQRNWVSQILQRDLSSMRYGGNIFGAKIIAQIFHLPFATFLGHDWDWLSMSISVGAHFAYFSESGAQRVTGTQSVQILSAALVQVEFPQMNFPKLKYFKNWSLYAEPQLWFIPSDVANAKVQNLVFTYSIGVRTSVF